MRIRSSTTSHKNRFDIGSFFIGVCTVLTVVDMYILYQANEAMNAIIP